MQSKLHGITDTVTTTADLKLPLYKWQSHCIIHTHTHTRTHTGSSSPDSFLSRFKDTVSESSLTCLLGPQKQRHCQQWELATTNYDTILDCDLLSVL